MNNRSYNLAHVQHLFSFRFRYLYYLVPIALWNEIYCRKERGARGRSILSINGWYPHLLKFSQGSHPCKPHLVGFMIYDIVSRTFIAPEKRDFFPRRPRTLYNVKESFSLYEYYEWYCWNALGDRLSSLRTPVLCIGGE